MLESIIVGLIVVAAAGYALWALTPGPTRLELARKLGDWGRAPGRPAWLARATSAIQRTAVERQGGCSGCSSARPPEPQDRERPRR